MHLFLDTPALFSYTACTSNCPEPVDIWELASQPLQGECCCFTGNKMSFGSWVCRVTFVSGVGGRNPTGLLNARSFPPGSPKALSSTWRDCQQTAASGRQALEGGNHLPKCSLPQVQLGDTHKTSPALKGRGQQDNCGCSSAKSSHYPGVCF